jgi:hypothetical protein
MGVHSEHGGGSASGRRLEVRMKIKAGENVGNEILRFDP